MASNSFLESTFTQSDPVLDTPLRPQLLDEFVGQEQTRERLKVLLDAAKQRGDILRHCLFSGPPGLGKTTLAHILAKMMGTNLVVTSGPVIEKAGDLAGILTNLKQGDILFIDELHRLSAVVEEYLYPAMEDFALDLVIDSGPSARTVQIKLQPFTLVGATTRIGLISAPMRSRFAFSCRLDYYEPEVLAKILLRTAGLLKMEVDASALQEISERARGTPRIANNLMRWVRDYAQTRHEGKVTREVADRALSLLTIDKIGLDEVDVKILRVIIDLYQGGPVGLNAIAASIGEEKSTIEEVYEPYLIMRGLLRRTPRGREVTPRAYEHLGCEHKGSA